MKAKQGAFVKHILILFTDQQRYDTIAANGNPAIQTPRLDALARESAVFDRCYTPSPVCVPARLSLLSGQYPARTGCNNNNPDLSYDGKGLYERLTEAGYRSCAVGKLHYIWDSYGPVGFETRRSQEELADPADEYWTYIRKKYPHVFDAHGMRSEMYYVPQISQLPPEDHPTNWIGDRSVETIEAHDPEEPLFLFSSFIHPHPPYCPPSPWQKLYREDPPAPYVPDETSMEEIRHLIGDRCSMDRLEISRQDILRTKNFYYACVSFVDFQIGRILDALKRKGMYDDTLIVFASDHGDMMGDFNAIGKRTMVDSACHIPLMIRCPGEKPCRRADVCSLVDLAPTLLRYAGIPYDPAGFDGTDLFAPPVPGRVVYSQHACGAKGTYLVTDGTRKLIYRASEDRYFYYDHLPEERDRYDADDSAIRKLKTLLDNYRASDVNRSAESVTYEPVTRKHPHYPGRMDMHTLHDKEAAAIPEEYEIDLN